MTETDWGEALRRERRRTGALLLGALAALSALALLAWLPLRREAGALARELERVEERILSLRGVSPPGDEAPGTLRRRGFGRRAGPHGIPAGDEWAERLAGERRRKAALREEWASLRSRIGTFGDEADLKPWLDVPEEGRIDFKVALFNARVRIAEEAALAGMAYPADLGVPETIGADESAEARLWQLAASVRFLELCMAVGVPSVERLEAKAPYPRAPIPDDPVLQTVYPFEVRLRCGTRTLQDLLARLDRPGGHFGLRRVRLAKNRPDEAEPVELSAVFQATVFRDPARRSEPGEPEAADDLPVETAP